MQFFKSLNNYIRLDIVVLVYNISTQRQRKRQTQEDQEFRVILSNTGNLGWGLHENV